MTKKVAERIAGKELVLAAELADKVYNPSDAEERKGRLQYRSIAKEGLVSVTVYYTQPYEVMESHPDKSTLEWVATDYEVQQAPSTRGRKPQKYAISASTCIPFDLYEYIKIESIKRGISWSALVSSILCTYAKDFFEKKDGKNA